METFKHKQLNTSSTLLKDCKREKCYLLREEWATMPMPMLGTVTVGSSIRDCAWQELLQVTVAAEGAPRSSAAEQQWLHQTVSPESSKPFRLTLKHQNHTTIKLHPVCLLPCSQATIQLILVLQQRHARAVTAALCTCSAVRRRDSALPVRRGSCPQEVECLRTCCGDSEVRAMARLAGESGARSPESVRANRACVLAAR
jgi:hypothetical protein